MRGFYIPYPCKADHGYPGVAAHEQKGADGWETQSDYQTAVQKVPAEIIKHTQNNMKDGGEGVKVDKGAHQQKDGFGGCRLRG